MIYELMRLHLRSRECKYFVFISVLQYDYCSSGSKVITTYMGNIDPYRQITQDPIRVRDTWDTSMFSGITVAS